MFAISTLEGARNYNLASSIIHGEKKALSSHESSQLTTAEFSILLQSECSAVFPNYCTTVVSYGAVPCNSSDSSGITSVYSAKINIRKSRSHDIQRVLVQMVFSNMAKKQSVKMF